MLPIGTINLYVSFTGASDPADPLPGSIPLAGPYDINDTRAIVEQIYADSEPLPTQGDDDIRARVERIYTNTETLPTSGNDCTGSSKLEDDADSAVPAPIARSGVAPASEAGLFVVAPIAESITLVSNASEYAESIYPLLED